MKVPPQFLLILATILWGGNFVIGRAVAGAIPPVTFATIRWCVALLIFFPIAYPLLKKEWPKIKAHFGIVVILALTGVAGFTALVYKGLYFTTSINASLMNSSTPIIIYILSFLFLKERLNKFQVIGTAISLIGVLFIICNGSLDTLLHFQFNKGDLLVILAVVCWAFYSLLIRIYAGRLPGYSTFFVSIFIGIIILLPFMFAELATTSIVIDWSWQTIGAIIYVGIFASIVAFLSWNVGVVQFGPNRASIYLNFIPLFAAIFAVIFLGEQILATQVIGGIAVVIGVLVANKK